MSGNDFNLLRKMPVFGGLTDATLQLILDSSTTRTVPRDAFFFREGDPADSFFVLRSGDVQIERQWHESVIVLGTFRKGDCVGEMSLVDLMPRSASVRALTDCEAIEINHRSLHNLYRQELEQYAIIMMNMGREISRRLRKTDDRLFELEQQLQSQYS